jgi:hypothetical protein
MIGEKETRTYSRSYILKRGYNKVIAKYKIIKRVVSSLPMFKTETVNSVSITL